MHSSPQFIASSKYFTLPTHTPIGKYVFVERYVYRLYERYALYVCMYAQTYTLTQNTLQLQSTVKPVWDHQWVTILCLNEIGGWIKSAKLLHCKTKATCAISISMTLSVRGNHTCIHRLGHVYSCALWYIIGELEGETKQVGHH